ncbi:MAG: hypothetical protein HYV07_16270 [Deltaproteobacteria bacterium]|nr:hypothetical protein [Deltaproteobacteria bacterium]
MRANPALLLLVLACDARSAVDLPELGPEIATRLLLVHGSEGPIVFGPGLGDVTVRIAQPRSEPARVEYLGWKCPSLNDLGVELLGTELRARGGGLPRDLAPPDQAFTAEYAGGSMGQFSLSSPSALGPDLQLARPTPCKILRPDPLPLFVESEFTTLAAPIDERTVVVGSVRAGLQTIDVDGLVRPYEIRTPTTSPPVGRALVFDDELWLYGAGGELWSGPKLGGEFTTHPPNPSWRDCTYDVRLDDQGRFYDLDARRDPQGGVEILVASDDRSVAIYAARTREWRVLVEPYEEPGRTTCPSVYSSVAALPSGEVIALHALLDGVLVIESDGTQTFERLPEGHAATAVEVIEGFGVLLGTAQSRLFVREAPNRYRELGPRGSTTGYVRAILRLGEGLFYGGGGAVFQQYYPDYGMCSNFLLDIGGGRVIVPLGDGFLDIPNLSDGRRPMYYLKPRAREICEPYPR